MDFLVNLLRKLEWLDTTPAFLITLTSRLSIFKLNRVCEAFSVNSY